MDGVGGLAGGRLPAHHFSAGGGVQLRAAAELTANLAGGDRDTDNTKEAIFGGVVEDEYEISDSDGFTVVAYVVRVRAVYRGKVWSRTVVTSPRDVTACGISYEIGKAHVFNVSRGSGQYLAGWCGILTAKDLSNLPPHDPQPGTDPIARPVLAQQDNPVSKVAIFLAGAVLLGVAGWRFVRWLTW